MVVSFIILLPNVMSVAFSNNSNLAKVLYGDLLLVLSIIIIILFKSWKAKIRSHNFHFVAREEMIRYWYNNLKEDNVDTDKLDEQSVRIRNLLLKYKGKELRENLANVYIPFKCFPHRKNSLFFLEGEMDK